MEMGSKQSKRHVGERERERRVWVAVGRVSQNREKRHARSNISQNGALLQLFQSVPVSPFLPTHCSPLSLSPLPLSIFFLLLFNLLPFIQLFVVHLSSPFTSKA
ncbi:hypothetical protein MANES_01G001951v8 [Manihot esculenta]|uniref:Uncharacterized protein n=1 Tax=Manihot esculenta TaxID=3983 RepID=A0ACB7IBY1_MANES|nr:hypothetical protein MANES_01G001951v8 [Manihot esculenta]